MTTELEVKESHGPCRKCGRISLLGDGLCETCWDKALGVAPEDRGPRIQLPDDNYERRQ